MTECDHHLPRELWALCLEWVLRDLTSEFEMSITSTLVPVRIVQMALVCKAWEEIAMPLLYTSVRLSRSSSLKHFASTMNRYPERWSFIKDICLHRGWGNWESSYVLHVLSQLRYPLSSTGNTYGPPLSLVPDGGPGSLLSSWSSLRILSLEIPVDQTTTLIMQALNTMTHLRELSLHWYLKGYMSDYERAMMHQDGVDPPYPASFPSSQGLALPFVKRFLWDSCKGDATVMNKHAIQCLASSQFATTCVIQLRGRICDNRDHGEQLAIFFQHHANGSWDFSELDEHYRVWTLRAALLDIRGPLTFSLHDFVQCFTLEIDDFPTTKLASSLPSHVMLKDDSRRVDVKYVNKAFVTLRRLRTSSSPPVMLSLVEQAHDGELQEAASPGVVALQTHIESLKETNITLLL